MTDEHRERNSSKPTKRNTVFVLFTIVLGLLLIAVGIFTDLVWGWASIITGTFTSVGAALMLAYVIFRMERAFSATITEQVRENTRTIIRNETARLSTRIDELHPHISTQRQETSQRQRRLLDALSSDVSYDTVSALLAEADAVGAINETIVVQASHRDPRLLVEFRWAPHIVNARPTRPEGQPDGTGEHLTVRVVTVPGKGIFGRRVFDTEWRPGVPAESIARELEQQLRKGAHRAEAEAFELDTAIAQLQAALRLAFAGQRAADGTERLRGTVREMLAGNWVITSEGLHHLDSGYFATPLELGIKPLPSGRGFQVLAGYPSHVPDGPENVDEQYWAFIFSRLQG